MRSRISELIELYEIKDYRPTGKHKVYFMEDVEIERVLKLKGME